MIDLSLQKYDVLQVNRRDGRGWLDFSTLRDEADFAQARRILAVGFDHAMPGVEALPADAFRVVRNDGTWNVIAGSRQ